MKSYTIENLSPSTLFEVIKAEWELLYKSLKEIGILNIQAFLNIKLEKIVEIFKKLEIIESQEEFDSFEKEIYDYIK